MLHPFRPLLTGAVLVAGAASADLVAALRRTARSVATGPAFSGPAPAAGFDAVVLVDPPGEAGDPADALALAAGLLGPGGRLVVVVENSLSLPRFAGDPGAASGPFGREERARGDGGVPPTRRALRDRLRRLGLAEQEWWFPFPDLRLVLSLVSERGCETEGAFDPGILAAESAPFAPCGPGRFSLHEAWAGVARAGLVGDFAPAFAVAASEAALPRDDRLALHFGHRRRPAFDKVVTFARDPDAIRVTRTPLDMDHFPDPPRRVDGVTNRFPDEPFVSGAPWQARLRTLLSRDGWTVAEVVAWAAVWREAVRALHAGGGEITPATRLPGDAIDAIPRNLMHRDGAPVFIDAEWEIDADLTLGHLLVRGLINAFTDIEPCGAPGFTAKPTLLHLVTAVAEGLGLPVDAAMLDEILSRESRFQSTVSGLSIRRDRVWLAATQLPLRVTEDPLAERDREIQRLRAEADALRADAGRRVDTITAELEEVRRRTDRVVRYAAELDRERGRLARSLAEMQALAEAQAAARRHDVARTKPSPGLRGLLAGFAPRRLPRHRDEGR